MSTSGVSASRTVEAPLGRLTSPVLVGRERELGLLLEAAMRPLALVLVEGEAGVGKSRLVQELLAHEELQDRRRYLGRCYELSEPFPLGPVVESLREAIPVAPQLPPLVGALRSLIPELADRLPDSPEPLGDRRAERHRLFRAVRELLNSLGPTVLVLEDLQWADQATLELLPFLVPQLPPDLVLVCTYRRQDLPEGSRLLGLAARLPSETGFAQVEVEPLGRDQVRNLVGAILQTDEVSDEFAQYLSERSGGLPFAVEEVLLLLRERRDIVRRSGLWVRSELEQLEVPAVLRDSIVERLGQLSSGAQELVRAAAVVAAPTTEDLLADIAELSDATAATALTEALSSALLVEDSQGSYGFRHVLARQAVEETIPSPLARRLHLRAAQVLERAPSKPLARLAHHYRSAGDTKNWIRYAEAAADRALSLEDDATAYGFLKEAVLVSGLPRATKGRLAVKLATHALYSMTHAEAIELLRRLLDDETLSRGQRGELRLCLARLLGEAGDNHARYTEIVRALEDLGRRSGLAARAMADLALPWVTDASVDEHLRWQERATQALAGSTDRAMRLAVLGGRAVTLIGVGDPRGWEAIEAIPEAGTTAEETKQAVRTLINLSDMMLYVGHDRRARAFIEDGLRLSTETGHGRGTTNLKLNQLRLDWVAGDWNGLERRARLYIERWADFAKIRAEAEAVLGRLLLARGEVRAAFQLLEPLARDFPSTTPEFIWVAGGLARLRLAEDRNEAAVDEAKRGLDIVEQKGIWAWAADVAPVSVEALLAAARHSEADELIRRFARGLRGRDAPAASAALIVSRALLSEADGDSEQAVRRFLSAERAWLRLPRPYEAARAREGAGSCQLSTDRARGQNLLVEAMDAFRELGATWDADRVRRTLREHKLVAPHRRGRKGYGDELSPREAQVAGLASEGLSNREIALKLFLSPKTIDRHLSSAMRKLGVRSRTQLPAQLGEEQQPSADLL